MPTLALGILSGTIVDRLDRRRVMVAADLARAALVGALALLVALGSASVPAVIALGMATTMASLFFNPARNAVLPAYVAKDELVSANALMMATAQTGQLLTPALGGILFVAIGPVGLLAVDAFSFVWSALLIARLTPGPAVPGPAPRRPLLHEAADGLRFIAGHAPSRLVILAAAGNQLFASGPYRVMVPAWVAAQLGGGAPEFGTLMSSLAAGLLLVNLVGSAVRARLPFLTVTAVGVFFDGLIFLVFAYMPTLVLASVAFFALGVANGILNLAFTGGLQTYVPSDMRGRTFATFSTGMNLTAPVSLAVTGVLAAVAGPVVLITASGIGLMAVGTAAFAAAVAHARAPQPAASTS
jgi:MFS family permease